MTTPRKSELSKTASAFRRAFAQLGQVLPIPRMARALPWRSILMPWQWIPSPVMLAMIALVALAMVLDTLAAPSTVATIGGQDVPPLACEEDETIGFVGIPDTLVCVHYENYAEQDAGGCIRPAFYVEAAGVCVLAVPPASTPAPAGTATPATTPTATLVATIGAPSAGMAGEPIR